MAFARPRPSSTPLCVTMRSTGGVMFWKAFRAWRLNVRYSVRDFIWRGSGQLRGERPAGTALLGGPGWFTSNDNRYADGGGVRSRSDRTTLLAEGASIPYRAYVVV